MMRACAIDPSHHAAILRNNAQFVHWLSPLDEDGLRDLLSVSDYARQCANGEAVLIGYDGYGSYRHKRVDWLARSFDDFFYIDRIIVGAGCQGQGIARLLYDDLASFARSRGHTRLACEVYTEPDNPASHAFHRALGFKAIGMVEDPGGTAVRFYQRKL